MEKSLLERAREFFKDDIYATETTGITLDEAGDGYARCSFEIEARHQNAAHTVMGGAIYTLADFAFAVASNCERPLTVTLSSQINFISAPKGKILTAEAKCYTEGGRTCCYTTRVYDELGTEVALITATGYKTKQPCAF